MKFKNELGEYLNAIIEDVPELKDHELFLVGKVANGNLENSINSIDVCLALQDQNVNAEEVLNKIAQRFRTFIPQVYGNF